MRESRQHPGWRVRKLRGPILVFCCLYQLLLFLLRSKRLQRKWFPAEDMSGG